MAVTANAVGMMPASSELAAPHLRAVELPDVFRPMQDGGILERPGVLAVFQCLHRHDDAGFAGGVFVVVEWPPGDTAGLLAGKGMPTSRDGRLGMLHNPVHLLGVEALISILAAAREGRPTAQARRPGVDLVVRALRDLGAGERLAMGGHFHEIEGADGRLLPAAPISPEAAVPFHLAADATLARAVPAGSIVRVADIVEPPGSRLWALRREQDALFAGDERGAARAGPPAAAT
jgi:predicted homoserine dehydrogenase-like protein